MCRQCTFHGQQQSQSLQHLQLTAPTPLPHPLLFPVQEDGEGDVVERAAQALLEVQALRRREGEGALSVAQALRLGIPDEQLHDIILPHTSLQ